MMRDGENNLVNVFVVRNVLVELVKHGTRAVSIEAHAIPEDAQLRGGGYDVTTNRFYLTFEHPSFRPLRNGELIPEVCPLFRDETVDRLNETTRLLDEERRRWYKALEHRFGLKHSLEGFAPEVAVTHLPIAE